MIFYTSLGLILAVTVLFIGYTLGRLVGLQDQKKLNDEWFEIAKKLNDDWAGILLLDANQDLKKEILEKVNTKMMMN